MLEFVVVTSPAISVEPQNDCRRASPLPFLKWAGGKRQLLDQIARFTPKDFSGFTEAFLGSGAVFFDLWSKGRLTGRPVRLLDNNPDLIGTYLAIARATDDLIEHLREFEREHKSGAESFYYSVRDQRFNPARRHHFNRKPVASPYPVELAASLIYLNRTCFNGLFRLNSKGEFNVPVGKYLNPRICDEENLRRVAEVLGQPSISVTQGDFEQVLEWSGPGDFIYFDPPYAPVSSTAHFRSYTATGFSERDQQRLQQVVLQLAKRGCWVLLSNSVAPQIQELYDGNPDAAKAGLCAHRVPARRAINCDGSARGTVSEYLITNVPRSGV